MSTYLIAMGLILAVMSGWLFVQRCARRFAARHPEFGPAKECLGCGLACACEENETTDFTDDTDKMDGTEPVPPETTAHHFGGTTSVSSVRAHK